MTLNEAKEIIEEFEVIDDWSMIYLPRLHEALDTLIRIAEWYENQDMIKRSDAIAMTKEILFLNTVGISIDQCGDKAIACMHEIPKAEPPKERNGDCETCKHQNNEMYCGYCYVRYDEKPNKYEPYIP